MITKIDTTIPLKTISEANACEHWRKRHKRSKEQKLIVFSHMSALFSHVTINTPCTITLTRIGKRRMDSDNAVASLKYVRDSLASFLFDKKGLMRPGRADGDQSIDWIYKQATAKDYAVHIQIEEAA